MVVVAATPSSSSSSPTSFPLIRDKGQKRRLIAQWLEAHPELKVFFRFSFSRPMAISSPTFFSFSFFFLFLFFLGRVCEQKGPP